MAATTIKRSTGVHLFLPKNRFSEALLLVHGHWWAGLQSGSPSRARSAIRGRSKKDSISDTNKKTQASSLAENYNNQDLGFSGSNTVYPIHDSFPRPQKKKKKKKKIL